LASVFVKDKCEPCPKKDGHTIIKQRPGSPSDLKNFHSPTTKPENSCGFTDIRVQLAILQKSFWFELEGVWIIFLVMCNCPERSS